MENKEAIIALDEKVQQDLAQITTNLPKYIELSIEEQKKVRNHMNSLDENDIRSINTYGKEIFEHSNEEKEAYLQTLTNGEIEIGNIQTELLAAFDREKPNSNFIERALALGKKKAKKEVYKRKTVAETTELLTEKTEKLRNELEQHYYRLQQMANDSAKERHEIELLIIAAKEKFEEIKQEVEKIESKETKTFDETQKLITLKAFLNKLVRKIQGDETRLITTTSRAITATYLAQGLDEAAFCFEQDMELAKPELRATAIFSSSRQIVTGAVDTYEKFQKNINAMAKQEAQKSVETLSRIKEMQRNPLYDEETLKEICKNTIEASRIVRQYHESQKEIPNIGSEYEKIYQDFTKGLQETIIPLQSQQLKTIENGENEEER